MRKLFIAVGVLGLAAGGAACSSSTLNTRVDQLTTKVDSMSQSLEQTQDRVRQDETKIAGNTQKADAAQQTADRAQQSATQAATAATSASTSAQAATSAVDALGRKLMYTVVLNDDASGFAFDKAVLPDEAKAKLDDIAHRLTDGSKNGYLDIEGFTDSTGSASVNDTLGLARARAVMRYLNDHDQVPLWRMSVISYGEDHPVAPNTTTKGRAENRRVEVKLWM